ncbi:ETC complex I subunit conserved region-domain-containing protein [Protomyces lactucae-debilis]|uniref:NADH dehydrogenase [ubiquinone] iron-sulfur protein 4, mitochondrial n=1 Tax=Protomyces lactucae-debilis TaxID=2754530 RepID=A0A1Y2FC95_PROLT|nr:ETC complex I subunit conserved region-domain-containing protein [Protomyces lactucae-debilis]ORY81548.1 ETC complex I subunit conserved region-domain-containing protein [Protomyces lactucae-debilis]
MNALRLLRTARSRAGVSHCRLNSSLAPQKTDSTGIAERDGGPKETVPVDSISGAPESLHQRIVRIYKPSKTAMQSGIQGTKLWRMDWDVLEKDNRWTNPLMGWASSGDFMQGTSLKFGTQDDAIRFAESQGWTYYLQAPHEQKFQVKSYSSNYTKTQMNPSKIAHTK